MLLIVQISDVFSQLKQETHRIVFFYSWTVNTALIFDKNASVS